MNPILNRGDIEAMHEAMSDYWGMRDDLMLETAEMQVDIIVAWLKTQPVRVNDGPEVTDAERLLNSDLRSCQRQLADMLRGMQNVDK